MNFRTGCSFGYERKLKKLEKHIYYDKEIGYTNIDGSKIDCLSVNFTDDADMRKKEGFKLNSNHLSKESTKYKDLVAYWSFTLSKGYIIPMLISVFLIVMGFVFLMMDSPILCFGAIIGGFGVMMFTVALMIKKSGLNKDLEMYTANCSVSEDGNIHYNGITFSLKEKIKCGTKCILVYSESYAYDIDDFRVFQKTKWFD